METKKKDPVLRAKIGGKPYALDLTDVTGREARDFRRAVGVPIITAAALVGSGEIDTLEVMAAMKWLIDRKDNPSLEYEDVLDEISYKDLAQTSEGDEADPPA